MESALEVLSRAATVVETSAKIGDALLGSSCRGGAAEIGGGGYDYESVRGLAAGGPPPGGKELTTRSLKTERTKDRRDMGQVLGMDKEHMLSLQQARKTATSTISTQTQYSSFKGEAPPYPGPPPPTGPPPAYFAAHDTSYHHSMLHNHHHHHQDYHPPPPPPPPPRSIHPSCQSSPSSPTLVDLSLSRSSQEMSSDVQNAPLNLSISSSGMFPSSSKRQNTAPAPRPSVITCLSSSSLSSSREGSPRGGHLNGSHANGHGSPVTNSPPVTDPAIEEHFRRSLGRSYENSIPKTSPSSTAASDNANVSVTESVDDHFAKALGDSTWKAIKLQNDPAMDVFTGSVDDHFAKALGAKTWWRIKAETEHCESSSNNKKSSSAGSNGYGPSQSSSTASPPASSSSLSATVAS